MNNKTGFIVVSPKIARKLLQLDYTIIDIKPRRDDYSRTIFIFQPKDGIEKDAKRIESELKI